jgi:alpha-L-fucosidase
MVFKLIMMTKAASITVLFLAFTTLILGQTAPKPYGVLPTPRQIKWQETEMYAIIHFSMATYDDKEWGYGDEPVSQFNPAKFNALQIVGAAKAGGLKGVVVVAKHHDGFCLWPTKTTSHNISQSPYKNGKGDLIKEYEMACKQMGMKIGLYCSPWDRNNAGYGKPEYVETYRKQLKELYKNYGPLFMSWHDGANGGDGFYGGAKEQRKIDRTTYYGWDTTWAITRALQPGAAIFGDVGPDVRWVGNEEGHAGETSWETYSPEAPEAGKKPANGFVKDWLGTSGTRNGKYWMPAECDVPLRPGWFYHSAQDGQSKSAYQLLDLYYKSVGRAASLDLGLSPNKDGVLAVEDVEILKQFGKILKQTFENDLAGGASFKASNIRGTNSLKYGPGRLFDKDRYSYWATDDKITRPQLTIDLHKPTTFNVIRLRENIKLGQRIDSVIVDIWRQGSWQKIAQAASIGANRLIRLPQNITASKLRLRVFAPVCIALSDFGLFKEPVHLSPPVVSRDRRGMVSITTDAPVSSIFYTIDGSEPGASSIEYNMPFALSDGGVVKAVSFENKQQRGESTSVNFGPSKGLWKALNEQYSKAIDDDPRTFARLPIKSNEGLICHMPKNYTVRGFTYEPIQKQSKGIVDSYEFYVSTDGVAWSKVAEGEFSNIKANPILQTVLFKSPVKANYFRFVPLHTLAEDDAGIAELGLIIE